MGYHLRDVVGRAIEVLDEYGLESLTMRRLAAELGLQPSALYHHVPNKQTLLAAIADEILRRGRRERRAADWDRRAVEVCANLRDAMLAYRDGADVVITAYTFGLGASEPAGELREALREGGLSGNVAEVGTRALLHLTFGYTAEEQAALQAAGAGAIDWEPAGGGDFEAGIELLLDGLRSKVHR
ncbi:TetR family transcriptional regulator [Amycolatopsis australiensis]|uniref:DNA-binding transcriptional regulator, AcrR family n=1 Tax=Amycolatopsis australiensis TaxID=546364 RepID=A0A1K1S1G8_9PSEU|nr:TetR family transcriptional regulator [Amycolatopsis australiensis]SFW77932.1 DNA-binding transcriptional regulator, AcrR family [Amycolatopsis australiensis]